MKFNLDPSILKSTKKRLEAMCDPKIDDKSPIYIETVKKGSDGIYSHHIYKKKALLGEGAFAKVYKVVCANVATKEKQIYALKEIATSKITSNVRLQRVKREIKIQKKLHHRHILGLVDSFSNELNYYLVLPLCTTSLGTVLRTRPHKSLCEISMKKIMFQIVLALRFLHHHLVLHRDLKPDNILLDSNYSVKVSDFGLSTILSSCSDTRSSQLGTANYMSRELVRKENYSFPVDIWALGCTMYSALYGKTPFQSNDKQTTFKRIEALDYDFPLDHRVSKDSRKMISALLHPIPEKR